MFGREYLDWRAEEKAGQQIDQFLEAFEPEDRKWVLAVLRKRFEVRVEYRDSLASALGRGLEAVQQRQAACLSNPVRNPGPAFGGALGSLLGG